MYLRWTRLFFLQLTLCLSLITAALAAWALHQGQNKKALVRQNIPGATLHIGDAIGIGAAVVGIAGIASLAALFFDFLVIRESKRDETIRTVRIKEFVLITVCNIWIGIMIPATIINVKNSGTVTKQGVASSTLATIVQLSGQNLRYKNQTSIKVYTIFGWLAFLSTFINFILASIAARHLLRTSRSIVEHETEPVRREKVNSVAEI